MNLNLRLLLALFLWVLIAVAAHEVVQEIKPKAKVPREQGLLWLKEEYHIPEENFRKIVALHEDYFARCDKMCAEMVEAHAPAHSLRGAVRDQTEQLAVENGREVCERCLHTMIEHLDAVASLMPEGEGKRFLKTVLPELTNPRELQELRSRIATPK